MAHLHLIDSLFDVTVASPQEGEVIKRVGAAWINSRLSLSQLQNIPSYPVTSGSYFLVYDQASGTYTWQNISSGGYFSKFFISGLTGTVHQIDDSNTIILKGVDGISTVGVYPKDVEIGLNKTGAATGETLVYGSGGTISWEPPISVASGSSGLLEYNTATRELSVKNLLISDVTVDSTQTSLSAWIALNYTGTEYQEGDILILTNTLSPESWIHNGGSAGTIADWSQLSTIPNNYDSTFRISNILDSTKKIAFNAANITTGTVRTLTAPDANGTIGLLERTQTWSGVNTFGAISSSGDITLTGGRFNQVGNTGANNFAGIINNLSATQAVVGFNGTRMSLQTDLSVSNTAGSFTPDASALVHFRSTTKGSIPFPVMTTTQRDAISAPATGLTIYNSTTNRSNYYNGTAWVELPSIASGGIGNTQIPFGTSTGNLNSSANLTYASDQIIVQSSSVANAKLFLTPNSISLSRLSDGSANLTLKRLGSSTSGDMQITARNSVNLAVDTRTIAAVGQFGIVVEVASAFDVTTSTIGSYSVFDVNSSTVLSRPFPRMTTSQINTTGTWGGLSTVTISNAGSGYVAGTYTSVPIVSSTGNGAGGLATIVVSGGGTVSSVTITTIGARYDITDVLTVSSANLGGSGSGFALNVTGLGAAANGGFLVNSTTNGFYQYNSSFGLDQIPTYRMPNTFTNTNTFTAVSGVVINSTSSVSQLTLTNTSTGATDLFQNTTGDLQITTSGTRDISLVPGNNRRQIIFGNGKGSVISDNNTVDAGIANSAVLKLSSTTRGFLPPSLTTVQRDAIISPVAGLNIYNNTVNRPNYYNGSAWVEIPTMASGGVPDTKVAYGDASGNLTSTTNFAYVSGQLHAPVFNANTPGSAIFGTRIQSMPIAGVNGLTMTVNNSNMAFFGPPGATIHTLLAQSGITATSGSYETLRLPNGGSATITLSSGTTSYTGINLNPSYNLTGTYSGIVRGFVYAPTLTSMTGADHRAIETTTGNLVFCTTSGNLGYGTATPISNVHIVPMYSSTGDLSGAGYVFRVAVGTANNATTAASGTVSSGSLSSFESGFISATNTGVTYTKAATVRIGGAPVAGTNVTITSAWALDVSGPTLMSSLDLTSGLKANDIRVNNPTGISGEGDTSIGLNARGGSGLGSEAIFNVGDQSVTQSTTGYYAGFQVFRSGGTFASKTNLTNGLKVGHFGFRGQVGGSSMSLGDITLNYTGNGTTLASELQLKTAVSGSVTVGARLDDQSRFWLASGGTGYYFPTTTPSVTNLVKQVQVWTGDGTNATPAWENVASVTQILAESYNNVTSTSSPVTLSSTQADNLINQGSTQASFTLVFPASPQDGQILMLTYANAITSLTLDGNGNTIIGSATTTAVAGSQRKFKFYTGVGWIKQY